MNRSDWQNQFPEVPERIHQSIVNTLEGLEERDGKRMKDISNHKKKGRRIMVILAAAMVAAIGTTALAAEIFKWNDRAKEVFVADEEAQNELVAQGNVTGIGRKVSDQGVSVELIQSIQDSHYFYALFEVSSEDGSMTLDEDNQLAMDVTYGNQESPFTMLEWGFVSNSEQEPGSSRYFEISGTKDGGTAAGSLKMNIVFSALQKEQGKAEKGDDIVNGSWPFELDVKQTDFQLFAPEMTCSLGGYEVKVTSVELSPLSVTITCDAEDIRRMEEGEGISIDQNDLPAPMVISGIRYQDGTAVPQEYRVTGFGYSGEGGAFTITQRFSSVVDVEKTEAVLMGNGQDEIRIR